MLSDFRIAKIYQQNAGVDNSHKTLKCVYGNTLLANVYSDEKVYLWCYCCELAVILGSETLKNMRYVVESEDWKENELT